MNHRRLRLPAAIAMMALAAPTFAVQAGDEGSRTLTNLRQKPSVPLLDC